MKQALEGLKISSFRRVEIKHKSRWFKLKQFLRPRRKIGNEIFSKRSLEEFWSEKLHLKHHRVEKRWKGIKCLVIYMCPLQKSRISRKSDKSGMAYEITISSKNIGLISVISQHFKVNEIITLINHSTPVGLWADLIVRHVFAKKFQVHFPSDIICWTLIHFPSKRSK